MITSRVPFRCRKYIIQQEMKFKYLGVENSEYGDREGEARRATKTAACLMNRIWKNEYLRIKAKTNKTYNDLHHETQTNTAKTKMMLEIGERRYCEE